MTNAHFNGICIELDNMARLCLLSQQVACDRISLSTVIVSEQQACEFRSIASFGYNAAMPGANCAIYGCGTNRRHVGVGIFRILRGKDDLSEETRKAWLNVITRDRVVDKDLQQRIDKNELFVCEKHFRKEEYETGMSIVSFLCYDY